MKTIRFVERWVLLSLLVSPLGLPIAAQANLNRAPSDPFANSYDWMTYRADTGSPTGALLHIKIRWWLIAWANGQGDALDRTTTFEYDAAGNVTKVIDPAFHEIRFTYDAVFNRVTTITDALNQVTEFTYDSANGNLLTTTDPLGNATQRAIAAREPDRSPAIADTVPLRWLEPRDGDRGRKTGNHQIRLRWQCGLGTGSGTICAQRP